MNYYFTGLLVLAFTILVLFVDPAYPKNEYLNDYGVRCGESKIQFIYFLFSKAMS